MGKASKIWLSFEVHLVSQKPPSFNTAITCCDISMASLWVFKGVQVVAHVEVFCDGFFCMSNDVGDAIGCCLSPKAAA